MNKLTSAVICLSVIALAECKTTSRLSTTSTPAPATPTVETKPAVSDSQAQAIAIGESIFQAKCQECHSLPAPADHDTEDWKDIMVKMARKAHLSPAETDHVLTFVTTAAKH